MNAQQPSLIGIAEDDTPLYRIFPFWFLEEAMRLRQLVLIPPERWEDPYEKLASQIRVTRSSPKHVSRALSPSRVYAQCWSLTEESDALLRAFSRVTVDPHHGRNILIREEGVKVRSTPRKLLRAIRATNQSFQKGDFFLGRVQYRQAADIQQWIADQIGQNGERWLEQGEGLARLMLLKRTAFRHEDEVRLMYFESKAAERRDTVAITIDPNSVFEDIVFDPRLKTFERKEREAAILKNAFKGTFSESGLYQENPLLDIRI